MTASQDANSNPPRAAAAALRLDPGALPRVTALGRGAVAEQILRIAFERGIPVREDADLAAVLTKLDVDSPIPVDALAAVAEILLYLYRAGREPEADPPA